MNVEIIKNTNNCFKKLAFREHDDFLFKKKFSKRNEKNKIEFDRKKREIFEDKSDTNRSKFKTERFIEFNFKKKKN